MWIGIPAPPLYGATKMATFLVWQKDDGLTTEENIRHALRHFEERRGARFRQIRVRPEELDSVGDVGLRVVAAGHVTPGCIFFELEERYESTD